MKLNRFIAGLALAAGVPASASAAIVTIDGTAFDVKYDDSIVALWGVPTLSGNSLTFLPLEFKTSSVNGPGLNSQATIASSILLTIIANDGYYLTDIDLDEGGNYYKYGGTKSNVQVSGDLRATTAGGLEIDAIESDPEFPFPATLPFTTAEWTADASVDLGSEATSTDVTLQNVLAAWSFNDTSGTGTFQGAFIEKRNVTLTVGVVAIPEPATWAMMATGAILLGFGLRRSRS